jgi:hypothetical protein
MSWTSEKKVARRDEYRCCLTGVRCRFWSNWDVFPIIPPTAFSIREVGQLQQYISSKFLILFVANAVWYARCIYHICPPRSTQSPNSRESDSKSLDLKQGRSSNLFQRDDQTRKAGRNKGSDVFPSLVLSPLTLPSTISSTTTLAAKLRQFIRRTDDSIGNVI